MSTAVEILKEVGGKENVDMLTHCATRLRFTLKDLSIVDQKKVDKISGVMGVVPQGDNCFQVVIGGGVADVYEEINELIEKKSTSSISNNKMTNDDVKAAERNKIKGKNKFIDSLFEFLSDSFRPIIGVLLGASLIIAFLNLLKTFEVIVDTSDTLATLFLDGISQSVFYFLPVLIAYNACKKLKVDPWVGAVCMLALFTPQFLALSNPEMYSSVFAANGPGKQLAIDALEYYQNPALGKSGDMLVTTILGLPLVLFNYKGNVFVPLLMSVCIFLIYKLLKKIFPAQVQLIFVPFFTMLIMVPVTAFILGPIGVFVGDFLGIVLSWLNTNAPFIFAVIIPILYPFLVPLGLHWPLNALILTNIDTLGYDFIQGPMGSWNFACFGATFGVLVLSWREANREMTSVASGALAAGLLGGVSEPSLYGIHLRYKKVYPRLLAGCVAGGLTVAILGFLFPSEFASGVTAKTFAFNSLLTIPIFDKMWVYTISIAVSFITAASLVIAFDYRTPAQKAKLRSVGAAEKLGLIDIDTLFHLSEEDQKKLSSTNAEKNGISFKEDLKAPICGKAIELKETGDKVFAMKALGEGIAVLPEAKSSDVVSPISGVVKSVSSSKHAYTIMTDNHVGVLIHVGIDTVQLNGEGFDVKVSVGDEVKVGDVLSHVDFKKIKDAGYGIPVILTIVNTNEIRSVLPVNIGKNVKTSDTVLDISN